MTKEELLKKIEELEKGGIDEEVGIKFHESGAIEKKEWDSLLFEEKVRYIENTEIYEWQDYYIGYYSAMETIKNLINKLNL